MSLHSLRINFADTGRIDYRQTFRRASVGYAQGILPLLRACTTGEPRFVKDSLGKPKGILIEGGATNLIVRSSDLTSSTGGWTLSGLASAVSGQAGAPDGTASFSRLTETTTNTTHSVRRAVAVTLSQSLCFSVYARLGTRRYVDLALYSEAALTNFISSGAFDLQNGTSATPGNGGSGSGAASGISQVGDGVYRLWLSGVPATSGTSARVQIRTLNDSLASSFTGTSGTVDLWNAQLEAGTYPSTPITTLDAASSRDSEALYQPTTGWFRPEEGSFIVGFTTPSNLSGTQTVVSFDTGGAGGSLVLKLTAGVLSLSVDSGSGGPVTTVIGTLSPDTTYTVGFAYQGTTFGVTLNGAPELSLLATGMPTVTMLHIGTDYLESNHFGGCIGGAAYYPMRLPQDHLAQLTR